MDEKRHEEVELEETKESEPTEIKEGTPAKESEVLDAEKALESDTEVEESEETDDEIVSDESEEVDELEVESEKPKERKSSKTKKVVGIAAIVGVLAVGGIGAYMHQANHVSLKSKTITVEYGNAIPTNADYYLNGSDTALKGAKVDVSKIDETKIGSYDAKATVGDKSFSFVINIKDTTAPTVTVKKNLYAVVGKDMLSSDILKDVSDLSAIKSVSFAKNQSTSDVKVKEIKGVPVAMVKYEKPGTQKNTLIVEDEYGNKTETEFEIVVVPEYVGEVANLNTEWNVIVDATDMDYVKDVTYDTSKVKSVTVDSKSVDTSKEGEYQIKYTVESASCEKTTLIGTVNVVSESKAEILAAKGASVYNSQNQKYVATATSTENKDEVINVDGEAHTHTWVDKTETVHHDAVGHYETVQVGTKHHDEVGHNEPIYDTMYVCTTCGYSDASLNKVRFHANQSCNRNYRTEKTQIGTEWVVDEPAYDEPITEDRWIQDQAAYDEEVVVETVCSSCGEKK